MTEIKLTKTGQNFKEGYLCAMKLIYDIGQSDYYKNKEELLKFVEYVINLLEIEPEKSFKDL